MKRYMVFSNGTQSVEWDSRNCIICSKYNECGETNCDIFNALTEAYFDDGTVSDEIAKRMGFDPDVRYYTWDCPERG